MMWYDNDVSGWEWVWMAAMMAVWAVLAIGAVAVVVMLLRRGEPPQSPPTAAGELDLRLARGEIDLDEYQRRHAALSSRG